MDHFYNTHRSLVRWLSIALGSPPWTLALEPKDVEGREAPTGYVIPTDTPRPRRPPTPSPRGAQGDVDWSAPFSAYLVPDGAGSRRAAMELASGVARAFVHGVARDEGDPPELVSYGGPERLPLWDYTGVAETGPADTRRPPDEIYGYVWADPYGAAPRQDPDDGTWSVYVTCTLSWRSGGRLAPPAPIAAGMTPDFEGEGALP